MASIHVNTPQRTQQINSWGRSLNKEVTVRYFKIKKSSFQLAICCVLFRRLGVNIGLVNYLATRTPKCLTPSPL